MGILEGIRREYIFLTGVLRTLKRVNRVRADTPASAADIVERFAIEKPDNIAIYFENRRYTYREYDQAGNQYARWALSQGIKRGDVVALLMENRPEYLFAWLGIIKIGAVAALINNNLTGRALAHSLNTCGADHLVLGVELGDAYASAGPHLVRKLEPWTTGGVIEGTRDLDVELSCHSPAPLDPTLRAGLLAREKCFYIYTSGTTGMPKAAVVSHLRVFTLANAFSAIVNATEKDRMYIALPLYHSVGGICAWGATITVGGSVILRRKFSALNFWKDCRTYEATLFQYVGELCRYLLNAAPDARDGEHMIRCAVGNGLRPEIWERFKSRFEIPKIIEYYGATESNVSLVNYDGHTGAVGRIPGYLDSIFQVKIVKFDVAREEPVRGADGFCIEAAPDEAGEAIGHIRADQNKALGRYEGYTEKEATEKKILRDAFHKGDAWFRTGDLLRRDRHGYFYFVDRIGDTFRWKGENVSTSEVAEVLSSFPGVLEANVYGVAVPGTDGRAGMAALVIKPDVDLNGLHTHLEHALPAYARPLFLRLTQTLEATGTFKHRKLDLAREGFDPATLPDALLFDHPKMRGYVPLTPALYKEVVTGTLRL